MYYPKIVFLKFPNWNNNANQIKKTKDLSFMEIKQKCIPPKISITQNIKEKFDRVVKSKLYHKVLKQNI